MKSTKESQRRVFNGAFFGPLGSILLNLTITSVVMFSIIGFTKFGIDAQSKHVAEIVAGLEAKPKLHNVDVALAAQSMYKAGHKAM